MRSRLSRIFVSLFAIFIFGKGVFAATPIQIQIRVNWEGRELQSTNLEALEQLRKSYPKVLLTHLVNPSYFLDSEQGLQNLKLLQNILGPTDEVGLYLTAMESLVQKAGALPKSSPTFWGYFDESDICSNDCGLDVPLAVFGREESFKIFALAHQTMKRVGFTPLKSFAIRGWLDMPTIQAQAQAFDYQLDLSAIDPSLVMPKLGEFPVSTWVSQRWGQQGMVISPEPVSDTKSLVSESMKQMQRGGVLEFNGPREILGRFDAFVRASREQPSLKNVFVLSLSQESAFQILPKLQVILDGVDERAKSEDLELSFVTAYQTKKARPMASNVRISLKTFSP